MTPDPLDIARAALALPGWRWMPGMLATGPAGPRGGRKRARVESTFADDSTPKCVDFNGRRVPAAYACMCEPSEVVPDLEDHATAGCLLALLGPEAYQVSIAHGTALACLSDHPVSAGPPPPMTLGAACVAVALRCGRWPGGGDM